MNVRGQIGADRLLGNGKPRGPLSGQSVDIFQAMIAGVNKILGYTLNQKAAVRSTPDGGDEGRPVSECHSSARSW